jgi:sn-glycerol 3-phosphate transport system permease protein
MSLVGTTEILERVGRGAAAVSWRQRWQRSWRRGFLPYALLAPSLLLLGLFTYLPVVRVVVESLYDHPHGTGVAAATFVGLGNFARVLADPAFRQAALNNLVYALGTLIPTLVLALAFALAVQRSNRFSAVLRTVFFFPSLVPLVAAASLFFFIFLPGVGLLDYYLARIGITGPNWLGDSDVALWSVIGLTVWKNAGYYMLFYIAGLQNISRDTIEAALIDGANAWQRLRYVMLPALLPTTSFVVVIALINLLTSVDHVIVLTRGGPSNATNLLLYYIFQEAHENFEYGKAAAATIISVVLLLAISLGSLRIMEKGTRGAA